MFAELAIAMAIRAATVVPTVVPTSHVVVDIDGVARTYSPPLAEDDPGWDCRTMGNRVCGVGHDAVHPDSVTVYGAPVDNLEQAHALSIIIGSALGTGSDSCVYFTPDTCNYAIDVGAYARGEADRMEPITHNG